MNPVYLHKKNGRFSVKRSILFLSGQNVLKTSEIDSWNNFNEKLYFNFFLNFFFSSKKLDTKKWKKYFLLCYFEKIFCLLSRVRPTPLDSQPHYPSGSDEKLMFVLLLRPSENNAFLRAASGGCFTAAVRREFEP